VITGQVAETLAPFLKTMEEFNPRNLKFLGMPIDYISFEEDGIYFIEVKSANASLTQKQRRIRELIKNKKVYFKEVRIN
jgi:predicted Holliday junction resolvase-like endonuclease